MEYEIEEEDLLFDHWSNNPSLHPRREQPGDIRPMPHRKEFRIPEEQMG